MGLGKYWFADVHFTGTVFVGPWDYDFIGIIFAYQSANSFYVFSGAKMIGGYWDCKYSWNLKRVNSSTGATTTELGNALTASSPVTGQTDIIWQNRTQCKGWTNQEAYRWVLNHSPSQKEIRIQIYKGINVYVG